MSEGSKVRLRQLLRLGASAALVASVRNASARSSAAPLLRVSHPLQVVLRDATVDDAEAIARIYAYYCERTTVTFQTVPSTAEDISAGIASDPSGQLPYLVAVQGSQVVGYSYATLLRAREGYASSCEVGIYLKCTPSPSTT